MVRVSSENRAHQGSLQCGVWARGGRMHCARVKRIQLRSKPKSCSEGASHRIKKNNIHNNIDILAIRKCYHTLQCLLVPARRRPRHDLAQTQSKMHMC